MKIFTIGFTKKSAREFFSLLKKPGINRLIDIRLNNVSQLAGFTKKNDLQFFSSEICGIDYLHIPELAPTKDILDAYKKKGGDWKAYEEKFLFLMEKRKIENSLNKQILDGSCLLCSEETPHHCHRRLVVEYLQNKWRDIEVVHL